MNQAMDPTMNHRTVGETRIADRIDLAKNGPDAIRTLDHTSVDKNRVGCILPSRYEILYLYV